MMLRRNYFLAFVLLGPACSGAFAQSATDQLQSMEKIVPQLQLTDKQQTAMHESMQPLITAARDARQAVPQATPAQAQARIQQIEAIEQDTVDKMVAVLTDDQKTKFYPLMGQSLWQKVSQNLAGVKISVATLEISDDQKKLALAEVKKAEASISAIQNDFRTVRDADAEKEYIQELAQPQLDMYTQLRQELGDEQTSKLVLAGRKAAAKTAPATQP